MNSIIKPKILLSVKDIHEISKVINYADIIDLKNPNDGPIGSWTIKNIKEVVRKYNNNIILSATLGNLKDLSKVKKKLSVFDSLGLNFIKIGCFCKSIKDLNKFLKFFKNTKTSATIVLVFFAENYEIINNLNNYFETFKSYNIKNIMIDTKNKSSRGLFENLTLNKLQKILLKSHKFDISIGLAGKLQLCNLINLLFLNPNVIGFRGAICKTKDRNSDICFQKVKNLSQSINFEISKAQETAGACIEA